MNILGFSAGYVIEEDRLLLTVKGDSAAHEYWLTRKATMMLAEAMCRVLNRQYEIIGTQIATQHNRALAAFGHQAATQALQIQSMAAAETPPPEDAILLYAIDYAVEDKDHGRLSFKGRNGQANSYIWSRDVMHAIVNLLQSQATRAGWGLELAGFELTHNVGEQNGRGLVIH